MTYRFRVINLVGFAAAMASAVPAQAQEKADAVVAHYADLALEEYGASLAGAERLEIAVKDLVQNPGEETLQKARAAWLQARVPYQQTEAYRFGNPVVDDWEGKVNAWPLDEGLIDYVDASYGTENDTNSLYVANVIANPTISIDGREVDASRLTPEFLASSLQEAGGIEANVATGYHAIEFLLWGQDLNGTGPGAGERPWTDFSQDQCTNGHCDRRAEYLTSAAQLLVSDLREMVDAWGEDGEARAAVTQSAEAGLAAILTGMGSLSYGELAGQRMKIGLLLHDPEEEHDCFSDNTHNSYLYNAVGIRNVYLGQFSPAIGNAVSGPAISDLIADKDPDLDAEIRAKLDHTVATMQALAKRAETAEAYDQMIGEGNAEGNALVQAAIDALIDQTHSIERAVALLDLGNIEFEGSDSLDSPSAVFQ